ncbi:MAG: Phosphate regulon transcriptional regulatory protein PhoB [Candidatus Omnitrophica bacterium]|nr:Phosphate regulon transcriptional regulatory protein PhoB [Candidatus Omnitrophota bacterium]
MVGTILIIGDQNKQGSELRDALKKETHFVAHVISKNGLSPSLVVEKEPDLLVMNPKTSYMEIMDLYYALKKEPQVQDVPIVLLMDESEMKNADLPSGIQEVLYRPLRIAEAVARIQLLFKRLHKVDNKNLIQRGKLVIDVAKYEVRVGDRKIDLTFTEFELLKFLCGNPGTVFTREVLLNKVWGYEYYGGTRTVDVHIRRLRSKIEGKNLQFIETVRNIGYKFASDED